MCGLTASEWLLILFQLGVFFIGIPTLVIFLIVKLFRRKNRLPYNLP